VRIVQTAFYALKDARTPLIAAGVGMVINLLLGAGLMHPLGHKGIALGSAGAAVATLGILLVALRRRIGTLGGKTALRAFIKAAGCSAAMGFMVTYLRHGMRFDHQADPVVAGLQLSVCVAAGAAGYLMLSWLCRSRELRAVFRIARHKGLGR
jgi:putative peptidoglycan lipid II flippase